MTKQYMIVEQGRIFEHGRATQYWNGDLLGDYILEKAKWIR